MLRVSSSPRRRVGPAAALTLWTLVVLLTVLGVSSAILRGVGLYNSGFASAVVAEQKRLIEQIRPNDPITDAWAHESAIVDRRFLAARAAMLLHVGAGGVFLALAPLQFVGAIRRRFIRFHRWSGRVLVAAAIAGTVPGFYFGVVIPYGGVREASAIAVFGAFFVVAAIRGFVAIRGGDRVRHREWMIRAFAAAIAISVVRVIGIAMLAYTDNSIRDQMGPLFWTGWLLTITIGELWIRHTRPRGAGAAA